MKGAPVVLAVLWALSALSPAGPGEASAQETGTVTGQVTASETVQPLSGVQVEIPGLDLGTLTDAAGRYELDGIPAGTHTLSARRIGYEEVTRQFTVAAGETVQMDFELAPEAIGLDAVVVTGTAGEQRRRAIGNMVGQIGAEAVEMAPVANLAQTLQGREAGVVVDQGAGVPGSASVIRIRGQGSMTGSNQPLIYVDGVRVNARMNTPQGGSIPVAISRMDDFSPEDIESIEVIKGPAAATLYGTEAAHGVIQITTKRGAFDQPAEWSLTVRQGVNFLKDPVSRAPDNWGIDPATGEVTSINLVRLAEDRGQPIFSYGHKQEYALSLSGGTSDVRYYLSGTGRHEDGVTPDSWQKLYSARANVSATPRDGLIVDANAGFALNSVRVPGRGTTSNFMRAVVKGRPELLADDLRQGFHYATPDFYWETNNLFQDAHRMTAGVTLTHEATDALTHRLTFGLDMTDEQNDNFTPHMTPYSAQFVSESAARGSRNLRQESVLRASFDYSGSYRHDLGEALVSTTSAGLQVNTDRVELIQSFGSEFPAPGVESVGGTATNFGHSDVLENNTVGLYLQQQFGWEDRRFITAAVRADDNSAFGAEFDLATYPKISGSWVVSEEDFWNVGWVNSLRLRAAYGESGQQPDAFDAIRTFNPRPQPDGTPAVYPAAPGNPDLGPERGQEIEAGWDAVLFQDRLSVDFTFYNQVTRDAIVERDVAPSGGFTQSRFVNLGEVSNRGVELGLDAGILRSPRYGWDVGLTLSTNRNRIEELGLDEHIEIGWTTRHQEGYPVASFFAPRVVDAEIDADGTPINVQCDDGAGGSIPCASPADAPWLFQGHPDPKVEGSLNTTFTFGERLQLYLNSDFKYGQSIYSTQNWWRYAAIPVAWEMWHRHEADPRVVAEGHLGQFGEFQLFTPESGYWRFREASLSAQLPEAWAQRLGASRARVRLAARNLGMIWTALDNYPFQDPENRSPANVLGGNREPQGTAPMPPLTSFDMTVNLVF